jgi:transcriptional regulator with XRE-family HTH domain
MTQEELGQGLAFDGTDLSKAAVSKWEMDRSQPTAAQLRAICQRLNVSANDLLGLAMPWDGVDRREHPQT